MGAIMGDNGGACLYLGGFSGIWWDLVGSWDVFGGGGLLAGKMCEVLEAHFSYLSSAFLRYERCVSCVSLIKNHSLFAIIQELK